MVTPCSRRVSPDRFPDSAASHRAGDAADADRLPDKRRGRKAVLVLAQRLGAKGFERHPAAVSQLAQPRLVCLQAHAADRFQRQRVKTLSGKLAIQQRTEQRAGVSRRQPIPATTRWGTSFQ